MKNNELKVPFKPVEGKEQEDKLTFEFGTREVVLVHDKGMLKVLVGLSTMSWDLFVQRFEGAELRKLKRSGASASSS